jgi:hypothetical protein
MRYAGGLMRYEKIEEHTCIWRARVTQGPDWANISAKIKLLRGNFSKRLHGNEKYNASRVDKKDRGGISLCVNRIRYLMAPPEWNTIAQKEYLQKQLPIFLSATEKKGTSLARFWGTLKEGWFELWPTETTLGVPLPPAAGEEDIRTEAQLLAVGKATEITQKVRRPAFACR